MQFNKLYNFDEKRLYSAYQRIQNMHQDLNATDIITNFLYNQTITNSKDQISELLTYFEKKLALNKQLLDFAFEWIRANKIRLEYKKYITLNEYRDPLIALDDAIFLFFMKYDELLRPLFSDTMEDYEFSTLYHIIFSPKQSENFELVSLLENFKARVPSISINGEKINIKIHALREGLSEMIKFDYNEGLPSDIRIIIEKKDGNQHTPQKEFDGTMVERLVKFYCFQKRDIDQKEITMAITQFLSSFFQTAVFYDFGDFKQKLVDSFMDYVHSGLTEYFEYHSIEDSRGELASMIQEFENSLKQLRLKGKAWIEDLKPLLQDFLEHFIERL
jgi:hypothetical protein